MKKYVFLTYTIKQVGGGQLYVYTKAKYLVEHGWEVKIAYMQPGELILNDFSSFETMYFPELIEHAYHYFKRKRIKIERVLLDFVGFDSCQEVVIESHSDFLATWGEILSQYLKAKHFVFLIAEKLAIDMPMVDFFMFKYERKELAGIKDNSIEELFHNTGFKLKNGSPRLIARGADRSVMNVDYDIPFDRKAFTIGVVGRFEKEYIKDTVDDIIKFVVKKPNCQFNVVYVGAETIPSGIKERIEKKYEDIYNVHLYFTGFIFPLPEKLVLSFNCCISSAGAAFAIARCGISTIAIDPYTLKSDGVLNVNTENALVASKQAESLDVWLERVFDKPENFLPPPRNLHSPDDLYVDHFLFISSSNQDKQYNLSFLKKGNLETFFVKFTRALLPDSAYFKLAYVTHRFRK